MIRSDPVWPPSEAASASPAESRDDFVRMDRALVSWGGFPAGWQAIFRVSPTEIISVFFWLIDISYIPKINLR